MDLAPYAELFRSEAEEHLDTIGRALLALEREPANAGTLAELFRSVHTLKGAAATMGFAVASELAHGMEHLLDRIRTGSERADGAAIDLLLQAADALDSAIEHPETAASPVIIDRLGAYARAPSAERTGSAHGVDARPSGTKAIEVRAGEADQPARRHEGTLVVVRIEPSAGLPGVRAMMALQAARGVGEVIEVAPAEESLLADDFSGMLTLRVAEGVDLHRLVVAVRRVGEIAAVEVVDGAAVASPLQTMGAASRPEHSGPVVRVPQRRLDALVDQMGELMIARDRLRRVAAATPGSELEGSLEAVSRQIDAMREDVMRLRMVPVGEVFDRFPRMVRDAARTLDRKVDLEIAGRDEEVDRSLLNEVADLLVHLLRNAIDHGIEPPEERLAAGKAEVGRIRVSATREGSTIRVEVADDGRGLQRERILAVAARRGLVPSPDVEMSDSAVWGLVTTAGFSTSERVSGVSGRGVGLDAVRSRARALGGSLEIRSERDRGASFALRLPLSLTLVRALRFEVAGELYSIPLSAVVEVADVREEEGGMVRLRDELLPALDLPALFALDGHGPERGEETVVVVQFETSRVGLIVDRLEGQHQAVIKPFDPPHPMLDLFSGGTILPDGRPSLILDPVRLAALASRAMESLSALSH